MYLCPHHGERPYGLHVATAQAVHPPAVSAVGGAPLWTWDSLSRAQATHTNSPGPSDTSSHRASPGVPLAGFTVARLPTEHPAEMATCQAVGTAATGLQGLLLVFHMPRRRCQACRDAASRPVLEENLTLGCMQHCTNRNGPEDLLPFLRSPWPTRMIAESSPCTRQLAVLSEQDIDKRSGAD